MINKDKIIPVAIAIILAGIVLYYYAVSGNGAKDLGARKLQKMTQVEKVETVSPNLVSVTCKNGRSYQIVVKGQKKNYEDLYFNACGESSNSDQDASDQIETWDSSMQIK